MKKILSICVLIGLLLTGCGGNMIVGKNIKPEDITDFYYTYENINYNAYYQRYRFYVEDGKQMFFHETRERKDDYGPCTEDDTILKGNFELSDEEWNRFIELISDGTVTKRVDSAESGSRGPWTFIYWTKDRGKYQVFDFADHQRRAEFEEFCVTLAERDK